MKARLIATLMMKQQVDVIVSGLVNSGYTVEPGLTEGKSYLEEKGNVCGLMVLLISTSAAMTADLREEIKKSICKVKHYSYSLQDTGNGLTWIEVGNFLLPEEEDRRNREKHADKLL